jgi:hypothetical protein
MSKRLPVATLCVLLVTLVHLLFVLSKWHAIPLHEGIPVGQSDPDTWLRLTLVRDWLAGGGWYDHLVHHSNAPLAPIASPWTRPVDLVIAFFVHLQPAAIDLTTRILHASLLLPVLWMALMMAGMMRAIKLIAPYPSACVMATLLILTQPGLWNYFLLGNADHHAPLAALFVWVLVGVFTPQPSRRLTIFTGVLFALQLWISVETLILIGAVYAYYGVCWLLGDREKVITLSRLALSTAIAAIAALMIERPSTEWLAPIYDSISIVYITALVLCTFTAWLLRLAPANTQRQRLFIAILGAALLIAGIGLTYPHLLHGPTYGVDPFIMTDFLPRITEARPFYKVDVMQLLPMIVTPLAAIIICLAPWIEPKRAFYPRRTSAMLAFFTLFTTIMYYSQQRWSYYMLPIAIVAIAPLLGALFTPEEPRVAMRWPANLLVGLSPNEQMKRRLPVTIALLGMPIMLMLATAAPDLMRNTIALINTISPADTNNESQLRGSCYTAARQLIRSGELDRVLPKNPQNILAPTDLGTELLFFTPHRIVASNYHREGPGIQYVWDTDKMTSERDLRAHLRQRHIDVILSCPKIAPEPGSLLLAYVAGKPLPHWLQHVPYHLPKTDAAALPRPKVLPLLVTVTQP